MEWILIDASWSMDVYLPEIQEALQRPGRKFLFRDDIEEIHGEFEIYGRSAVWDCVTRFATRLLREKPGRLTILTDWSDNVSFRETEKSCIKLLETLDWDTDFPIKGPKLERACSYNIWSCSKR